MSAAAQTATTTDATAVLLGRDLDLSLGERTLPAPGPTEALIRVGWAGVCGSDLHVLRSGAWVTDWPATLGHEIYGHVVTGPADGSLPAGTAVVSDSRLACGGCDGCRERGSGHCTSPSFVGEACSGGFATHCVLPAAILHPVDPEADGSALVLAEPLAVVLHALAHVRGEPRSVAIVGHGPIGALTTIEVARRWPDAQVTVIEPAPLRRALAAALGAAAHPDRRGAESAAHDLVVDAAGYSGALGDAIELVAVEGDVLLVALGSSEATVDPVALVERRITLHGCHVFVDELEEAIALLTADPGRYAPVVTDAVTLDELPARLRALLDQSDAVKVVVRP